VRTAKRKRLLLVGLNADLVESRQGRFVVLADEYCAAIAATGAIPILLPTQDSSGLDEILPLLTGLVLIGGDDLDCRPDASQPHEYGYLLHNQRETFDRRLIEIAQHQKMPVLAIGTGMQELNVCCGGSLFRHLPADVPAAPLHYDHMQVLKHKICVRENTWLAGVQSYDCSVVSSHHMAVSAVAPTFRVSAVCPAGIIEAIECVRSWFAIGVQFHPEHKAANEFGKRIFEAFVCRAAHTRAARSWKNVTTC
jgi:putative glutamine amidotransferase